MRIKIAGKVNTAEEMIKRIIEALKSLPLNEISSFSGVNLYFNMFDEDGSSVELVDNNKNTIDMIINKKINRKQIERL